MKAFSFCMVLWLAGALFISFNCLSNNVNRSILVSGMIIVDGSTMTSRNLKVNRYGTNYDQGSYDGDVSMEEDYRAIDPPPSSKASVKRRPIEHGTPSMPHIPKTKPSPPTPAPFSYDGLT